MKKIIKRNPELSEEEDHKINVEPLIPKGYYSEKLFISNIETVTEENIFNNVYGWWIIPVDYYTRLEEEMKNETYDDFWRDD